MGVSENPFTRTYSCKAMLAQIVEILMGPPITATPLQSLLSARVHASVAAMSRRLCFLLVTRCALDAVRTGFTTGA